MPPEDPASAVLGRLAAHEVPARHMYGLDMRRDASPADDALAHFCSVRRARVGEADDATLQQEFRDVVKHLEDARVTVNFFATKWFRDAKQWPGFQDVTPGTGLRNSWLHRTDPARYLATRDTAEQQIGNYNQASNGDANLDAALARARQFAGDVNSDSFLPANRPRYGTLDVGGCVGGGASEYGSSFLVLREHMKHTATFTYKDSLDAEYTGNPARLRDEVCTFFNLEHLLLFAPDDKLMKLRELATGATALGQRPFSAYNYIEAQLHSEVEFARDVAELHLSMVEMSGLTGAWTAVHIEDFCRDNGIAFHQV